MSQAKKKNPLDEVEEQPSSEEEPQQPDVEDGADNMDVDEEEAPSAPHARHRHHPRLGQVALKRPTASGKMPRKKLSMKKRLATKATKLNKGRPAGAATKKKHRWRPGTKALREIRKYQKSTDTLLRRAPFQRLVREVAQDYKNDLRFQAAAIDQIQEAAEAYLVQIMEEANMAAIHTKRCTIMPHDMRFALRVVNGRVSRLNRA